jgi:hypothetical protein
MRRNEKEAVVACSNVLAVALNWGQPRKTRVRAGLSYYTRKWKIKTWRPCEFYDHIWYAFIVRRHFEFDLSLDSLMSMRIPLQSVSHEVTLVNVLLLVLHNNYEYCHVYIRRVLDWMIGFIDALCIHTVRDYRQYSAIAILHTFPFTVPTRTSVLSPH